MVLKWSPQSSHHEEGTNPLILKRYELIKTIILKEKANKIPKNENGNCVCADSGTATKPPNSESNYRINDLSLVQ